MVISATCIRLISVAEEAAAAVPTRMLVGANTRKGGRMVWRTVWAVEGMRSRSLC
jgi:hypothetical protein